MHHASKLTQLKAAPAWHAGSWMKLRNIGVLVTAGQLQGVFTPMSKWARWPSDAGLAAAAASRYDSNVVAGALAAKSLLYYLRILAGENLDLCFLRMQTNLSSLMSLIRY